MSYAAEHFDAILQLWYPGSQGGSAAAKLLFGEVSPSGKLPVTFYETLEELPAFEDYSMKGRTYRYMGHPAQYPFGFGLTYGDVRVTDANIRGASAEGDLTLAVTAENAGNAVTDEVLQIYVKCTDSANAVPNPALAAFGRIHLEAGEKKTIEMTVPARAFTVVDEAGVRSRDGKQFVIYAGVSQPDARSRELTGKAPVEITYHII